MCLLTVNNRSLILWLTYKVKKGWYDKVNKLTIGILWIQFHFSITIYIGYTNRVCYKRAMMAVTVSITKDELKCIVWVNFCCTFSAIKLVGDSVSYKIWGGGKGTRISGMPCVGYHDSWRAEQLHLWYRPETSQTNWCVWPSDPFELPRNGWQTKGCYTGSL